MIGVLGPTGQVGTPLVRQLLDRQLPVRALAHTQLSAEKLLLPGLEVSVGDMREPAAMDRFLDGVEQLFLLSPVSPDQVALQNDIVDAAARAGTKGIVKLSVYTADETALSAICRWHAANDDYIAQSGLDYTILQPHTFMQTLALVFVAEIQATGGMSAAVAPDLQMSIVHALDIAEVAVAIFERGQHDNETLLLTGPAALSYVECARLISERVGRTIDYVEVPPEVVRARLLAVGMPDWLAEAIVAIQQMYGPWDPMPITDVIERWTGHPPRTFVDFLDDNPGLFG